MSDTYLSARAQIIRDRDTKAASLHIDTEERWELFQGLSVEAIDRHCPILTGEGGGIYPLDVSPLARSFFLLKTRSEQSILAETHLPMEGGFNFRDIGGIYNKEGKMVRWNKLIRSDELNALTDADLDYLSSLPLRGIVDFRSKEEIEGSPDRITDSVTWRSELSMNPGNFSDVEDIFGLLAKGINPLMVQMYNELVSSPATIACYKEFFSLAQDENNTPLIYHCTAGKDRTGLATAFILYALDVDEAVIMKDYLDSNYYLTAKYNHYVSAMPDLKSLFEVNSLFLESAMETIKKNYGSMNSYLQDALGIDIDKFRKLYLY